LAGKIGGNLRGNFEMPKGFRAPTKESDSPEIESKLWNPKKIGSKKLFEKSTQQKRLKN
jgi:hypothetical protein